MEKRAVFSLISCCFLLTFVSCTKQQVDEIAVDSEHVLSHALDFVLNDDSNPVPELIHVAGDVAQTIEDIVDEDTDPNLN